MADRRIRIPDGKGDLVRRLMPSSDGTGPFRYQVDVLAFAAAVGANRDRWIPVEDSDGEPIRQEVFDRQNYTPLINLLAVLKEGDARVLADIDEMEEKRAEIFEGFANGGLEILAEELRGSSDHLETLVLLLAEQGSEAQGEPGEFDLRDLLASS